MFCLGFFVFQNTFSEEKKREERIRFIGRKGKGKQNLGTVTDEETKTFKRQRKEQSTILEEQQTIVDVLKNNKMLGKTTVAGVLKVNMGNKGTKEIRDQLVNFHEG